MCAFSPAPAPAPDPWRVPACLPGKQRGPKGETEADTGTEAETSDSEDEEEEGLGAAMSEEVRSQEVVTSRNKSCSGPAACRGV